MAIQEDMAIQAVMVIQDTQVVMVKFRKLYFFLNVRINFWWNRFFFRDWRITGYSAPSYSSYSAPATVKVIKVIDSGSSYGGGHGGLLFSI